MAVMETGSEIRALERALKEAGFKVVVIDPAWKLTANLKHGRASFAETVVLRMDPNDVLSFYWWKYETKISDASNASDLTSAVRVIANQLSVRA